MIPKIKKIKTNKYPYNQGSYMVIGDHGTDLVDTYLDAIRYWLWHCGVPAKIAFKTWKRNWFL